MQKLWISETRKNLICVDSYEGGVLKGRLYSALGEDIRFSSLSQLLVKMEELLDCTQEPQAYTTPRRFAAVMEPSCDQIPPFQRKGALATFELKILFRQNTSWQGLLTWREGGKEQSFRSVLELILLMDSALRAEEER